MSQWPLRDLPTTEATRRFIPAAGLDLLLPLYDPFMWLVGGEFVHRRLIHRAQLQPGQRVLEIGCGTGSLAVLVKTRYPTAEVVGLDPDERALARARRKAERRRVSVQFDRGFADELPYPEHSYDRVLSSFMFHHLSHDEKRRTINEVRRVLRPGGFLHLVDVGGHEQSGSGQDAAVTFMRTAGFPDVTRDVARWMLIGRLFFYRARAPIRSQAVGDGRWAPG